MSANSVDWTTRTSDPTRLRQELLLQRDLDQYLKRTDSRADHIPLLLDNMRKSTLLKDRKVESEAEPEDDSSSVDSSDQSSDSAASSEDDKKKAKKVKASKNKKRKASRATSGTSGLEQLVTILAGKAKQNLPPPPVDSLLDPLPPAVSAPPPPTLSASDIAAQVVALLKQEEEQSDGKKKAPGKVGTKVAFKRVDQVYDRKIHNFKLKETVQSDPKTDQWDQVCL